MSSNSLFYPLLGRTYISVNPRGEFDFAQRTDFNKNISFYGNEQNIDTLYFLSVCSSLIYAFIAYSKNGDNSIISFNTLMKALDK